jgi:intracellular septation protein
MTEPATKQSEDAARAAVPHELPSAAVVPEQSETKQLLKMLVELGPLVAFFAVNSLTKNIYVGTGVFMAATAIALVVSRLWFGQLPVMPLISGFFVLLFGGLTLWLHDAMFIKLKPTIVNVMFACILAGGLAAGKPLLRYVLGDVFKFTDAGWRALTIRWAIFFIFLAIVNEIVWRNFSESFWIGFKMFGVMPMTAVFGIAQLGLLKRYALHPEQV